MGHQEPGYKANMLIQARGGVAAPAGPALAGPLFSGSLVSFPDCIGTHMLLYIQHAAASDMAHSATCSSSASQSSPTRRSIAETPHSPPPPPPQHAQAQVIFYLQWPDHF